MDWALLVFVVLTGYAGYRGYRAGLLPSLARLTSLLAGYLAALLFTRALAGALESLTGLEGIAALLAASLALFVGAALGVALAFRIGAWILGGEHGPTPLGRAGGAAIGLATGALLSILVIWAGGFVHDLYQATDFAAAGPGASATAPDSAEIAAAPPSRTAQLADSAVVFALDKALAIGGAEPGVAEIGSALVRSPDRILGLAMRLAHGRELAALVGNPANHPTLDSGDIAALQRLPDFERLAAHPDMRALMATLHPADAADEAGQDALLAARIDDIWRRTRAVERDPRVLQILADADFRDNLAAGNPLALVNDAQLLELMRLVMNAEPAAAIPLQGAPAAVPGTAAPAGRSGDAAPPAARKPVQIYRWQDDSGRLIYSDEPPPEGR